MVLGHYNSSLYKYNCCEQGERVEGDEVNIYGRLDPIDVGESRLWDLEISQGELLGEASEKLLGFLQGL